MLAALFLMGDEASVCMAELTGCRNHRTDVNAAPQPPQVSTR
jgi:hypothetical protein